MRETVKASHPDGYTLLRFVARELDDVGRRRVERHVEECAPCTGELEELRWIDEQLTQKRDLIFSPAQGEEVLPAGDPYRERPALTVRRPSDYGFNGGDLSGKCLSASREAHGLRDTLLAAEAPVLGLLLTDLSLDGLRERYGLGYALDEAPRRMAEGATRYRPLAELTLDRLSRERVRPFRKIPRRQVTEAEYAFPLMGIAARAHLLDGIICNWTGEFDRGKASLESALRAFADSADTELSIAVVELHEAQRRTFANDARAGLLLARRARATFEEMQSQDDYARAAYAEGVALSTLDRNEEAIEAFRTALPIFEAGELWNPYVGAVHGIACCLLELGRAAEAKREYARALKLTAGGKRPTYHAYVRKNLAASLFQAGQFSAAIPAFRSAVTLFEKEGLLAQALGSSLYVLECLARTGRLDSARHQLDLLEARLGATPNLDPAILRGFADLLSGDRPDFDALSDLRNRAEEEIHSRLRLAEG